MLLNIHISILRNNRSSCLIKNVALIVTIHEINGYFFNKLNIIVIILRNSM